MPRSTGCPSSGSNSDVSVTITDPAIANAASRSGIGAERRAAADLQRRSGQLLGRDVRVRPGLGLRRQRRSAWPGTSQIAQDIQVPTAAGLLKRQDDDRRVRAGGSEQHRQYAADSRVRSTTSGSSQQAGETDAGEQHQRLCWIAHVGPRQPRSTNNSYKCYPNAAIAADPTLESLHSAPRSRVELRRPAPAGRPGAVHLLLRQHRRSPLLPEPQRHVHDAGARQGDDRRQGDRHRPRARTSRSPTRAPTRPPGTVELTVGGKLAGTAKFSLQPKAKGTFKIALTAKGKAALARNKTVKVAPVSQTANVASVSNWDQPFVGKSVKL